MTPLDADRALALAYVPVASRPAVEALWRLDAALGAVLASGREPMISRIKLAWWRDALERLDHARAPAEPTLQLLGEQVIGEGVTGAELAELEQSWALLLGDEPLTPADLDAYAKARGARLFQLSARLLGTALPPDLASGGEAWALMDLARHSNRIDAEAALAAARARLERRPRWPSALRPLGMLAALSWRDAERGLDLLEEHGAPRRMAAMLRHRITGR